MKFSPIRIVVAYLMFHACLIAGLAAEEIAAPSVIPMPEKMNVTPGSFKLSRHTKIYTDAATEYEGTLLAERLRSSTGFKFPVLIKSRIEPAKGMIVLTTEGADAGLGDEGYEMSVTKDSILIRGPQAAGIFYGTQTLLELLPPEILSSNVVDRGWEVPCVRIIDQPRFKWRGMMLDVSRHFSTKTEVEQMLDVMALHKLNTFHWHLTDDQAWRIEIKKYPRLTEVGAWRTGVGFKLDPKATTNYGPDGRYGGFYTQDDIRDVVKYAAARHITIVPEIEMPGHASAALMAYPQFSCTGGPFTTDLPGGVFNGEYCVGNEASLGFVEDILTEVMGLFPSKYIHIGGDEVPIDNWKACAKCQALMRTEGMHDEHQLEAYFIHRIETFVDSKGHCIIGWSEIRENNLAPSTAIMDWIGGAVEAATAGHDTVMAPLADCYFDHYQTTNTAVEPHTIGGYLPVSQVYAFEPMPAKLETQFQSHILGAQANVWTEYMPSMHHVQYMVFPRLSALAEVVWSPQIARNWKDFARRLPTDEQRLDQLGINYRHDRADADPLVP